MAWTVQRLRLRDARHPLLEKSLQLQSRQVVPLDLELPADARALVVSGPNAGGKSVALKTVGVLVLLAQCGWDVPARADTRLPLVLPQRLTPALVKALGISPAPALGHDGGSGANGSVCVFNGVVVTAKVAFDP